MECRRWCFNCEAPLHLLNSNVYILLCVIVKKALEREVLRSVAGSIATSVLESMALMLNKDPLFMRERESRAVKEQELPSRDRGDLSAPSKPPGLH